jgi:hypothetical protein
MKTPTPEQQLAGFIAKFDPAVATLIRGAREKNILTLLVGHMTYK